MMFAIVVPQVKVLNVSLRACVCVCMHVSQRVWQHKAKLEIGYTLLESCSVVNKSGREPR